MTDSSIKDDVDEMVEIATRIQTKLNAEKPSTSVVNTKRSLKRVILNISALRADVSRMR